MIRSRGVVVTDRDNAIWVGIGRPVMDMEGDGSVMMNIHAVDTVAQYNVRVFLTVLSDSAFGSDYHQLVANGLTPREATLHEMDFAGAITKFARERPFVVDAKVSREVVSVAFRRLHFGQEA